MNWLRSLWPGRADHTADDARRLTDVVTEVDGGFLVEAGAPMVTAVELWKVWRANVVDAEDRWGGRAIRIVGRVERVERRGREGLALLLQVDGRWRVICCLFAEAMRERLAGVRPGEVVVVTGVVRELWAFECVVEGVAVQQQV
jgi:hypothetical protein